jgi:dihydropyrimidine dehydrogenase (NAD+) subunit PreA
MADLRVHSLDLMNPFIIASSPATQGVKAVLRSARTLPGCVVMRNFGHGAGGGTYSFPSSESMRAGGPATQIHAIGTTIKDPFSSLEEYCEAVRRVRREMPTDVKLWVSVGHASDVVTDSDWQKSWTRQAAELQSAGADALELHFNTPGVTAFGGNRIIDYYRVVQFATAMVKRVATIPVMVKLPVEGCDPLRAMEAAVCAGADGIGPTARWKAFVFDLDWKQSTARPGGGYGGTQALPIACYTVAEARLSGITTPVYAGGGVFSWDAAAKLIMAGSDCVQLGSLACCLGPGAVVDAIRDFGAWMDRKGYPDLASLRGEALQLFTMPPAVAKEREVRLGNAYREAAVDSSRCTGCGRCVDACWHEGIDIVDGLAAKAEACIGCGYCFQVCPTGALRVDAGAILGAI